MCAAPAGDSAPSHFTNGLDLHFDYNGDSSKSAAAKKKKKKKKKKGSSLQLEDMELSAAGRTAASIPLSAVDLNDPDAEYPEDRVIKVDASGNLIVESLDQPKSSHVAMGHSLTPGAFSSHNPQDTQQTFLKLPGNLERSMFHFKDEKERQFWNELPEDERHQILDINVDMVMDRFRQQRKSRANTKPMNEPSCINCNESKFYIQETLENAYIPHLESFIDSTWNISDTESSRLKVPKPASKLHPISSLNPLDEFSHSAEDMPAFGDSLTNNSSLISKLANCSNHKSGTSDIDPHLKDLVNEMKRYFCSFSGTATDQPDSSLYTQKFIECLYKFSKEGKEGLPKAIAYLKNVYSTEQTSNPEVANMADNMSSFADMLMKDDGQNFLNMVEYIKSGDGEINDLDKAISDLNPFALKQHEPVENLHDNLISSMTIPKSETGHFLKSLSVSSDSQVRAAFEESGEHNHGKDKNEDSNDGNDIDYDDDDDDDDLDDEDEYDDHDNDEDDDINFSENSQERLEELRGLFMIQAIHMIREKFRTHYEKKLSEDRTNEFMKELEAEENAKKERELKKLRQKEEQLERKRLQKLTREDEKKRREDAEREKALAIQQKQEALRSEQLRRREELAQKKQQEKERKIEILRRKEEEQKELKRIEAEKIAAEKVAAEKAAAKKNLADQRNMERQKLETVCKTSTGNTPSETVQSNDQDAKKSMVIEDSTLLAGQTVNTAVKASQSERLASLNSSHLATEAPGIIPSFPLSQSLGSNSTHNDLGDESRNSIPADGILSNDSTGSGLQNTITPATNHLLEQLYQAQPPLSIPSIPSPDCFDLLRSPPAISSHRPLNEPSQLPDLWGSSAERLARSSLLETQNNPLWNLGYSRSSSIWGNSAPLASTWGVPPTIPNNEVMGSQMPSIFMPPSQSSMHLPLPPIAKLQSNLNQLLNGFGFPEASKDEIQAAAVESYQLMLQRGQLLFGAAPALSLFLLAKSLLQRPTLPFSEFLRSLNSSNYAIFDLVYDDFGSVTHIKVSRMDQIPAHSRFESDSQNPSVSFISNPNTGQPGQNYRLDPLSTLNSFQDPGLRYEVPKDEPVTNSQMW